MKISKLLIPTKFAGFAALAAASTLAWAWAGEVSGQIASLDVANDTYSVRVTLHNNPVMCGSTTTWAYLSETDKNYKAYFALLLAAKVSQSQVLIYSERDPTSGYCHIGYVALR